MSVLNKQAYCVGGLPVTVYNSNSAQTVTDKPVFILFFLHGRTGKAEHVTSFVETIFQDVAASKAKHWQDLFIVTFVRIEPNLVGRLLIELD